VGQKTYYTQLRLAPLGQEEAEELLTSLVGNDGSLKPVKPLILGKTEGTPFFIEEVVQTLAEEGVLTGDRGNYCLVKSPTEIHISPTVQGVLAARIDRLASDEKALVQQLAVIGREFPSHAFRYGYDPGVYCRCFAGWNLWCLGYPEQALKNTQDALHLAHEVAHPFTLAFASGTVAVFHQFRHEATAVREQTEASLTLSTEQGFVLRAAYAASMRGWVLAAAGQLGAGVGQMQEGLAATRATGSETLAPYYLALQAEIYGKMRQPEAGLAALAEALAMVQRTGEQWYEAELYRLKGELTLAHEGKSQKAKGKRSCQSSVLSCQSLAPSP
jgi:hypothetical protein